MMKKNTTDNVIEKDKIAIIYSTFSCDIAYELHDAVTGSSSIIINGLSHAKEDDMHSLLITSKDISSKLSLEQYELLKLDHVFTRHVQDNHIKVEIVDIEEVQEDIDKDVTIENDNSANDKKEDVKTEKDC